VITFIRLFQCIRPLKSHRCIGLNYRLFQSRFDPGRILKSLGRTALISSLLGQYSVYQINRSREAHDCTDGRHGCASGGPGEVDGIMR
jgi:hypothetical protein